MEAPLPVFSCQVLPSTQGPGPTSEPHHSAGGVRSGSHADRPAFPGSIAANACSSSIQVESCRPSFWRLPTTSDSPGDGPHPPVQLVPSLQTSSCVVLAAVPPTCPKQRSTAVTKGQHRSTGEVADLRHRRTASRATVLPELAVSTRLGRAGAANGRSARSAADKSGTQTPKVRADVGPSPQVKQTRFQHSAGGGSAIDADRGYMHASGHAYYSCNTLQPT